MRERKERGVYKRVGRGEGGGGVGRGEGKEVEWK